MLDLKLSNGKKLDIKYPIRLSNSQGKVVYYENSDGFWYKCEFNAQGKVVYYEDSTGFWFKKEYNEQGKEVYHENSDGFWYKCEYNGQGEVVYSENSKGVVRDNRSKLKEYSMEELEEILGHPLKIKSKGV